MRLHSVELSSVQLQTDQNHYLRIIDYFQNHNYNTAITTKIF